MSFPLAAGRAVVLGSLVGVIGLAWAYLALMATHGMDAAGAPMGATAPMAWTASYAASMFVMWVLMMVAMMLPSALPMILLLDRYKRVALITGLFAAGYAVVWVGFSAVATAAQWALEEHALLSSDMALTSKWVASWAFIAAGLYQFTPLKRTCLTACRSPLGFLSMNWRPGPRGALIMGMHHGVYCLGCCWMLMLLLFVGGVMSLVWVVPIALFVLIEKCVPGGERMGKVGGALLIAWGAAALFGA